MDSLRKANNVSANGQRKHHDNRGQINEVLEDDRELEDDEDSKEEAKENKQGLMGMLASQAA